VIIDRTIVEGQLQGGFAQGLGAVLLEGVEYADDGDPLVRTLRDYAMPTARDVPPLRILHRETPSALPGGYRGVGESATILAPAMLANAVHDALRPLGVAVSGSDLRPRAIRDLLRAAGVEVDLTAAARAALRR
jgi:carbon-monoxide dehydrogenase large subunit